jgi:hypothetical protein
MKPKNRLLLEYRYFAYIFEIYPRQPKRDGYQAGIFRNFRNLPYVSLCLPVWHLSFRSADIPLLSYRSLSSPSFLFDYTQKEVVFQILL